MINKILGFFKLINQRKICIIQARMGSSRLPGKVLKPINGIPALKYLYDRIRKSKYITDIVIATTENQRDDELVKFCIAHGYTYFCGSENDVLGRVHECSKMYCADIIIDVTADCIFLDAKQIDKMIKYLVMKNLTYVDTDVHLRSWPDGSDIMVYTYEMIERANEVAVNKKHRSHCGWNIIYYSDHTHPKITLKFTAPGEYCYPDWSLVLDTEDDYKLLNIIAEHFGDKDYLFTDVIDYLKENPELLETNKSKVTKIPGEG